MDAAMKAKNFEDYVRRRVLAVTLPAGHVRNEAQGCWTCFACGAVALTDAEYEAALLPGGKEPREHRCNSVVHDGMAVWADDQVKADLKRCIQTSERYRVEEPPGRITVDGPPAWGLSPTLRLVVSDV